VNLTTANFFQVAGLEVREGRGFTQWDREGTQKVAVVNTSPSGPGPVGAPSAAACSSAATPTAQRWSAWWNPQ